MNDSEEIQRRREYWRKHNARIERRREYWRKHNARIERRENIMNNIKLVVSILATLLVLAGSVRLVLLIVTALETYINTKGGCR